LDRKDLVKEWGLQSALNVAILLQYLNNYNRKMPKIVLHSICKHLPSRSGKETVELISLTPKKTLRTEHANRHLSAAQTASINEHFRRIVEHFQDEHSYLKVNLIEFFLEKKVDPSTDFDVARLNSFAKEAGAERTYVCGTPS
jgi:hypothetical protein